MADTKTTALAAFTPVLTDIIYGVDDPGGTPVSGKMTLQALMDLFEANFAAPASAISSGTFADARVAESNVTQHQAALSITESQISDLGTYATLAGSTFTGLVNFSGTDHAGLRLNSLTTTQRDALTPAAGDLVFNTTTGSPESYDGSAWVDLTSVEGTAVLSTGEAGGSKFLREDGDGTCSWQAIPGGGDALTSSPLSQFAATTSAQLAGVMSDETGTGALVFANTPTLVTPEIGAATGTSLTLGGVAVPTISSTDTLTNKTVAFGSNTLTDVMSLTTAQSVNAGVKKTFQADATNAGIRLAGVTANPSTLVAGDLWYRSDSEKVVYRGASAARNLVAETLAQALSNKTIDFASNTLTNVMSLTTAQSVTAGIKKTFQADATNAGLRLAGVAADPSSPVAGDIWYRTDTEKMTYRGASTTKSLVTEGGATFTGLINFSGTNHHGLRLISLTTTERDALSPLAGHVIYNSTTSNIEGYDGTSWLDLGAAAGAAGDLWSDPVDANIIPDADSTRDLGSASVKFANLHVDSIDIGGTVIDGTSVKLTDTFEFVIDGGGSAITTGVKGYLEVPFDCTISAVTMLADQTGSIVIDVWKDTYANYPPTDADSITASAVPTISSAVKSQDSTLTGWTTALTEGDILGFNVDSATTVTRVTISLKVDL